MVAMCGRSGKKEDQNDYPSNLEIQELLGYHLMPPLLENLGLWFGGTPLANGTGPLRVRLIRSGLPGTLQLPALKVTFDFQGCPSLKPKYSCLEVMSNTEIEGGILESVSSNIRAVTQRPEGSKRYNGIPAKNAKAALHGGRTTLVLLSVLPCQPRISHLLKPSFRPDRFSS